ncbi:hypothetical protein D4R20_03420 [bacterium]|nr:MAG: hypothetical protein D4R20_03420 [bacterium]
MGISLAVKIWGDSTPLLTELEKVKKHLNQVSKELTKMGSALSMALTLPIVAFGALSVKNFGEAEKAAVSLAAAIRANGKDVESTMSGYDAFAAKMQEMTTHEDDAVRGFLQLAESMQAPDVKKATQDAIGLNAAYGIEMTAAIKMATAAQLGNFTMLGKAVPAIKMMKDTTEKAALANKIFADGFTMATDQAKSGLGPLEQMKNDLNNMTESFGKIILEGLTPMIKHLKDFAKWLDSLSESTKRWVLGILAVVAAAGPLLFVMGKLPGILSVMINGFTMLTGVIKSMIVFLAANPWIILAAAIAAVGVAFYLHATRVTAAEAATKALNDTTAKAIENIASEKQHVEGLLATARNEKISKEERLKAVKDLNDISPKYFGNLTLEKVKTEDATTATKLYCEALLAKAKVEIATTEIAKLMAENDKIAAGASDAGKLDGWQKTTALIVGVLDVFGKVTKDGTSASMEFNMVQQNTKEKLANNNAQIAVYNDFISKNIGLIDTSAKAHISHAEGIGKEADAIAEIDKKIKSLKTTLDNQIVSGDKNAQSTANQIVQLEKLKASYEGLADIMMGKVSLKTHYTRNCIIYGRNPCSYPGS